MTVFATLMLAHLLADFPLQTNQIFKWKVASSWGVALHVAIHVVVTAVFITDLAQYWPVLAFLAVTHFLTDWLKLRVPTRYQTPGFVLDQLAHWLTLGVIAFAVPNLPVLLPDWVLYPAVVLAFIPALLMGLWIFANDLRGIEKENCTSIEWACQHLLLASQKVGFWLVLFVFTSSFIVMV